MKPFILLERAYPSFLPAPSLYWRPDVNLLVVKKELTRPEINLGFEEHIIKQHEVAHPYSFAYTGTAANMARFCAEGNLMFLLPNKFSAKEARENILLRETANNRLYIQSYLVAELSTIFFMEHCLSLERNFKNDGNLFKLLGFRSKQEFKTEIEESLKRGEKLKEHMLSKPDIKKYYDKLLPLVQSTRCNLLPIIPCIIALDIPLFSKPWEIGVVPCFDDPRARLDVILFVLDKMQETKPLVQWVPIKEYAEYINRYPYYSPRYTSPEQLYITFLLEASGLETGLLTKEYIDSITSFILETILYRPIAPLVMGERARLRKRARYTKDGKSAMENALETFSKHITFSEKEWNMLYRILIFFIGMAFIDPRENSWERGLIFLKNPLVPANVSSNWWIHLILTLLKLGMLQGDNELSGLMTKTIERWYRKKSSSRATKLSKWIFEIASAEADSYIEDSYKESCDEVRKIISTHG